MSKKNRLKRLRIHLPTRTVTVTGDSAAKLETARG